MRPSRDVPVWSEPTKSSWIFPDKHIRFRSKMRGRLVFISLTTTIPGRTRLQLGRIPVSLRTHTAKGSSANECTDHNLSTFGERRNEEHGAHSRLRYLCWVRLAQADGAEKAFEMIALTIPPRAHGRISPDVRGPGTPRFLQSASSKVRRPDSPKPGSLRG